jgi:solute:Na+ symporter, SSS family
VSVHLATADWLVLAVYFAAVLAVGFLSTRRSSDAAEYLLAGRSLTLPLFVMTLVSTWYGGILGVGEFSYLYGISNWVVQGVPYYFFASLFALFLAGKVRASNLTTIPDKLQESYGRPSALFGAFLTFLLTTPAPYVFMIGILLQLITGWPLTVCLLAGTAATIAYLFSGGFRADISTDVLEFFLMFGGFAVILPYAYHTFGGWAFITAHVPPLHLTWHGGNTLQYIAVWFLIALWTLVDPSFHQRCYAARSPGVARKGILVSILFWMVFDGMTATAGLYARAALPGLAQPVMAFPLLAEATLPPVAKGVFYAGMLATIMSTLNTVAFVSATSLGRDIVWRLVGGGDEAVERYTRWGLVVTGVLAIGLSLLIPSVIRQWYTIGTVIVPGLLVPLVTAYFVRLRARPGVALGSMIAGWSVSLLWLAAGWMAGSPDVPAYPLGIEPMFPGLSVSLLWWGTGLLAGRLRSPHLTVAAAGAGPRRGRRRSRSTR